MFRHRRIIKRIYEVPGGVKLVNVQQPSHSKFDLDIVKRPPKLRFSVVAIYHMLSRPDHGHPAI
jgi:hypothetical protein